MPIRINFLAERQVAEEMRRRDPVKRVGLGVAFVVSLFLLWAGYLQGKVLLAKSQLAGIEGQLEQVEAPFQEIKTNQAAIVRATKNLEALQNLAEARFLWGNALDALQYATVEGVEVVRIRTKQDFRAEEKTEPKQVNGRTVPGKPATSTERVSLTLEAKDSSSEPGEGIFRFQEAISQQPFFVTNQVQVELTGRTPVQTEPKEKGKPFVMFTVECKFPDQTR